MKIINEYELDLIHFDAWGGAVPTLNRIIDNGKTDELEGILEDTYPEGMSEDELNDLLWYEDDTVFSWLDLRTEGEIRDDLEYKRDELAEKEEELETLKADYESDLEDLTKEEQQLGYAESIWESDYEDDANDLEKEIAEIKKEIAELEAELEDCVSYYR